MSSSTHIQPLPSDEELVVKKLKEHDEILRHATAASSPSTPGGTGTYATADAPFLVLSNTTNLTNERRLVFDTGDFTVSDGGANGDYDVSLNSGTGSLHAPVTLAIGLDNNLLALTGQQLGLDQQSANLVFAGPSSGGAAAPSFRALVDADVPSSIARSNLAYVTIGNTASLSAERALVAGAGLTLTDGGGNGNATIDVVAANTSLIINADSMQVRLATNSGLTVSSGLTLGTPTTLTASSTNAVSGTAHSHAIDSSIARSAITVTGTGALGGGGALTANQAITMNTPGTLSVSSTSASSTNHTHAITSSSAVTTATASLLASDSNGRLRLVGFSVGGAINGDGNTLTTPKLYTQDGTIAVSQSGGGGAFMDLYSYGSTSSDFPAIRARRGRGTRGSVTAVQSGDILFRAGGGGYDGSGFENESAGFIQAVAGENWTTSAQGTEVQIYTTPAGSTTAIRRLVVSANGDVYQYADGPVRRNVSVGGNSTTNHDINYPDVSTAGAYLRLFRETSTTGPKQFIIYRGNNSSTADHTFTANGGYVCGSPTGGDKGVGAVNVSADVYKNNSAYTNPDYALEAWRDGRVVKHAHKPGAQNYRRLTLGEVEDHIRQHLRLPGFTDVPAGIFKRGDMVLEKIEELFTYLIEMNHKIEELQHG